MPFLTVFTPAYNRAHTLPGTYESLKLQEDKDFIWLVVDDGSSDGTADLVRQWMSAEKDFEIRYLYKENGGMHSAHNTAYAHIDTELNVCIDSDDRLAPGAVARIRDTWEAVRERGYAGLIALDADTDGRIIGKGFPKGLKETTLSGYYAAGGAGDKKLVYRTDIITKYPPYPEFTGERYVALGYKYRLIDQDYKLYVLPEVLCLVDYQPDGSSATMYQQYLNNPQGFAFWRKVCMQYPESRKRRVLDCIHYCSSSRIAKNRNYIAESPAKGLTIVCTVPGMLLTRYIRRKASG